MSLINDYTRGCEVTVDVVKRGPGRPPKVEPVKEVVALPDVDARKPTHDARIQYYKVLEYVLLTMKFNCLSGNYAGWYRGLRQFHIMVVGYVPNKSLEGLPKKFGDAAAALAAYQNASGIRDPTVRANLPSKVSKLDELFFSIEQQLHYASKDMMLPTGGLQNGDLDIEQMLRNSGL